MGNVILPLSTGPSTDRHSNDSLIKGKQEGTMTCIQGICCSHRATLVVLVIVTCWALLTTLELVGLSETIGNIVIMSMRSLTTSSEPTADVDPDLEMKASLHHAYVHHVPDHLTCDNKTGLPGPEDPVWLSLRWNREAPRWVIYNRVPKTGSSMVKAVISKLSKQNKFHNAVSPVNVFFNVSITVQEAFVQSLYHLKTPLVYDRHIYFVDFERYGEKQPMYINTVRDPIPHYLSFYYFMRRQSNWKNRFTEKERKMDLDECLNNSLSRCEPHRQYQFYCGQDPFCYTNGSEEAAVALAKRNIDQYYAVVGLSEDLHGFFSVLEVLSPHLFRGAGAVYLKHKNDFRHFTTKKVQPPLKSHTRELLQDLLRHDFELYNFAKQRFHKQLCLTKKLRSSIIKKKGAKL